MAPSDAARKQREFLFPAVATYYDEPLRWSAARGCTSGTMPATAIWMHVAACSPMSVGHANPRVVQTPSSIR